MGRKSGGRSPWALTFYAITLIGATMNDFAKEFSNRIGVGVGLILAAVTVSMYTGMMVIWRHDNGFKPGIGVWAATLFFVAVTVGLCHEADA